MIIEAISILIKSVPENQNGAEDFEEKLKHGPHESPEKESWVNLIKAF